MDFAVEKAILPEYPKTPHLPHKPNTDSLDRVATAQDVAVIYQKPIAVEEKIDGASCGMAMDADGNPIIRNRDHILRKGYVKDTAAKKQFTSTWNWFYENKGRFKYVNEQGPYSVFGEWCLAQHGIQYTKLPDWFIAYDVYDFEKRRFLDPALARSILKDAGFSLPRLFHIGPFEGSFEDMERWANETAEWAETKAEGVYIKVYDNESNAIIDRFKMVREDFVRGQFWNPKKLTKNGRA